MVASNKAKKEKSIELDDFRPAQLDTISITDILVYGRYGVSDEERSQFLPLVVDVELQADLSAAALSDSIADTIDYSELKAQIVSFVSAGSCCLLEKLASDLLNLLFKDPRIIQSTVTISKSKRLNGATPKVTITRLNSDS